MSLLRTVSVHNVAYSQQQINLKRLLDEFHVRIKAFMLRECKRKELGAAYEDLIYQSLSS